MPVHTRQSGGPFTPPSLFALTSSPNGGWSHIQEPRAIHYNGYTYFTYIDGTSGDCEVGTYDGSTATAFVLNDALGGAEGNPDHHGNAALCIRDSDHKLIAAYAAHDDSTVRLRVSTNSLDSDPTLSGGFAAEQSLDASLGGTDYTYLSIWQLLSETNDPVYIFYRDFVSSTGKLAFSTSTDGGATWAAQTTLYSPGAGRTAYWKVASDRLGRIDFVITDGSPPADSAPVKTYHFYYSGGSYFKSDGTALGSPPFAPADLTLVYDGADGKAWPWDLIPGSLPRFILQVGGVSDNSIRDYRWDGSAWQETEIATTDGVWVSIISPGACYDRAADMAYVCRKVAGVWEVFRYVNDGDSWSGIQLTSGSSGAGALQPQPVWDAGSQLRAMWMEGTYTSYLVWQTGIEGFGVR